MCIWQCPTFNILDVQHLKSNLHALFSKKFKGAKSEILITTPKEDVVLEPAAKDIDENNNISTGKREARSFTKTASTRQSKKVKK